MNLTLEQSKYIKEHLRDPEKTYAICATAKKLAEFWKNIEFTPDEIERAALIMNIGETSETMSIDGVSIYSKEYGPWDDRAKQLNLNRGNESVRMALEQGIELSDDAQAAIISTSRGGTLNRMAIALKLVQTMEAIKYERWSRGEKKAPAKDIAEVIEILNDELGFMLKGQDIDEQTKTGIQTSMISAARGVYVSQKQQEIRRIISCASGSSEKAEEVIRRIPEESVDAVYQELITASTIEYTTEQLRADAIYIVIEECERGKFGKLKSTDDLSDPGTR